MPFLPLSPCLIPVMGAGASRALYLEAWHVQNRHSSLPEQTPHPQPPLPPPPPPLPPLVLLMTMTKQRTVKQGPEASPDGCTPSNYATISCQCIITSRMPHNHRHLPLHDSNRHPWHMIRYFGAIAS